MNSIMVRLDNHKDTLEELLQRVTVLESWRTNLDTQIDDRKDMPETPALTTEQSRGL